MSKRRIFCLVLCALLIALTLAFIWSNSLDSKAESGAKSRTILGWVRPFLAFFLGEQQITNHLIRKLAHFVEFFALGAESCCFAALLGPKRRQWTAVTVFGLAVAAIDETIQIFTNRGPSLKDVGLDFCGFAAGLVCIFLFLHLLLRRQTAR